MTDANDCGIPSAMEWIADLRQQITAAQERIAALERELAEAQVGRDWWHRCWKSRTKLLDEFRLRILALEDENGQIKRELGERVLGNHQHRVRIKHLEAELLDLKTAPFVVRCAALKAENERLRKLDHR